MKKILVIDDSFTVRREVGNELARAGFEVVEAREGAEALACLKASPNGFRLVFCDINMPGVDGFMFLERWSASGPPISDVPVVMLTTEGDPRLMQQAKALGAKGWIVKPFKPEVLVLTAKKLGRLESSRPRDELTLPGVSPAGARSAREAP